MTTSTDFHRERLDRFARALIWAGPIWAILLFLGTLSHQPPPQTDFPGYARYITTSEFLISHLVASIIGAGIGNLGLAALFILLAQRGSGTLALLWAIASVVGNTVLTSVFGAAAFAQPAIGRMYLSGQTAQAMALQDDVYGVPLFAMALGGVLVLTIGLVLNGIAVARSGWLPRWAGIGLAVSGPLFAFIGVALANIVQTIGALGLVASLTWIAWRARRTELSFVS